MRIAITREVSPRIAECELTYLQREPIDPARAAREHDAYEECLQRQGCTLVRVAPVPDLPDGVFVEDAAVVLDEVCVVTRPGAESRQNETDSVAETMQRYRPVRRISAPATIDGGDVLRVERTLYVGRSQRTNDDGIAQLRMIAAPLGYEVVPIDFTGCLHLKSAATTVGPRVLLCNPQWIDRRLFREFEVIDVDDREAAAANALWVGAVTLIASEHQRTRAILERHGIDTDVVPISEMLKAEAGVTCCSLIFDVYS